MDSTFSIQGNIAYCIDGKGEFDVVDWDAVDGRLYRVKEVKRIVARLLEEANIDSLSQQPSPTGGQLPIGGGALRLGWSQSTFDGNRNGIDSQERCAHRQRNPPAANEAK